MRAFLAELRRRGVFKVATTYLVTGWLVTEAVGFLFQNFGAPSWVLKVFTILVAVGFLVACLVAWGFDRTPDGLRAARYDTPGLPSRSDPVIAAILLLTLAVVAASLVRPWRTPSPGPSPRAGAPVIVIMDTLAPRGIYDEDTRQSGATNADVLNEVLRDLPVAIHKELIGATWDREDQLLKQQPALVMIHRSALFHSMNQEFGFGYPGEPGFDEVRARRLYEIADNKLGGILGFIGRSNGATRFLVYSRGTGGGWDDEQYRLDWVASLEGRFPSLQGRVTTLAIPGGVGEGSLHDEKTRQMFRQRVQALLGLTSTFDQAGSGR